MEGTLNPKLPGFGVWGCIFSGLWALNRQLRSCDLRIGLCLDVPRPGAFLSCISPRPYNPNRGRCKAYCLADMLMENQLGLSSLSAVWWVAGVWEGFRKLGSRLTIRRIA